MNKYCVYKLGRKLKHKSTLISLSTWHTWSRSSAHLPKRRTRIVNKDRIFPWITAPQVQNPTQVHQASPVL